MKKYASGVFVPWIMLFCFIAIAILSSCKPEEFNDLKNKQGNFYNKIDIDRTVDEFKESKNGK